MKAATLPAPLIALLLSACTRAPDHRDIEALKLEGNGLLQQIEAYAAKHNGQYPQTLETAGIKPPKTRWGAWRYSFTEGQVFVAIGEYGRGGFVLYWSPRHGWCVDA